MDNRKNCVHTSLKLYIMHNEKQHKGKGDLKYESKNNGYVQKTYGVPCCIRV
ncbi:hypothetical protein JCM16418A_27770 [Paenibacillus pini]